MSAIQKCFLCATLCRWLFIVIAVIRAAHQVRRSSIVQNWLCLSEIKYDKKAATFNFIATLYIPIFCSTDCWIQVHRTVHCLRLLGWSVDGIIFSTILTESFASVFILTRGLFEAADDWMESDCLFADQPTTQTQVNYSIVCLYEKLHAAD